MKIGQKNTSTDQMEFGETKHTPWSDAEMLSAADIMQQKQCLCVTGQEMVARMNGRFAEKGKK